MSWPQWFGAHLSHLSPTVFGGQMQRPVSGSQLLPRWEHSQASKGRMRKRGAAKQYFKYLNTLLNIFRSGVLQYKYWLLFPAIFWVGTVYRNFPCKPLDMQMWLGCLYFPGFLNKLLSTSRISIPFSSWPPIPLYCINPFLWILVPPLVSPTSSPLASFPILPPFLWNPPPLVSLLFLLPPLVSLALLLPPLRPDSGGSL